MAKEIKTYIYEIVKSKNNNLLNKKIHLENQLPTNWGFIGKDFVVFEPRGARLIRK